MKIEKMKYLVGYIHIVPICIYLHNEEKLFFTPSKLQKKNKSTLE